MDKHKQPIVTQEWSLVRLMLLCGGIMGLVVTVFAVAVFPQLSGKAVEVKFAPSPFIEISIPPAKTALTPPYIRLVIAKPTYTLSTAVPVDVYMNTAGQPVTSAILKFVYDPNTLELNHEVNQNSEFFRSVDVSEESSGTMSVELFVNPELGHEPVRLNEEARVATLLFKTRALKKDAALIALDFMKGNPHKSAFFNNSGGRDGHSR